MPERYRAFICYSHADDGVARWLQRALESYRIPARIRTAHGLAQSRLTPVFRDRDELATSSDLSDSIREALERSDALIVICSSAAAESRWVNAEIEMFLARGAGPVICVWAGGDSQSAVHFPPALRAAAGDDASVSEPLAADVRADGRRLALLKVVAGLLRVGLDELVRRDTHRRYQRIAGVASGAVAGMLLTSALAVYALAAERRAVSAQVRSEHDARVAAELTEFMVKLFGSTNPADRRGADITARELLERGADRVATTASDTAVSARIEHAIGRAYLRLVLLPESEMHLHRAEVLLDQSPPDEALSIEIAADIAIVQVQRHEFGRADELLTPLVARAKQALGPMDKRTLALVGNLGVARLYKGQVDDAENLLEQALAGMAETLGENAEDTVRTKSALAMVYGRSGRVTEAIALLASVLEQQRATLGEDHPNTIDSQDNLATLYMRNSDWSQALPLVQHGLQLNERVYGKESSQAAIVHTNLSRLLLKTGDFPGAERSARAAVRMFEASLGPDHESTLAAIENLAEALQRQGDTDAALELLSKEIDRMTVSPGGDIPKVVRLRFVRAATYQESGNDAAARAELDVLASYSASGVVWQNLKGEVAPEFAALAEEMLSKNDDNR